MKLFQKLLVAPAALGLLAPAAVNASELNINGVSDYAATGEQVTSITQFSDVYPTDWAYQALSNLIERYGCVAGYPNGTYRGNRAMTRFEAAALLNACLDRVTEVTDELKRLMKEFEQELAILKGRVDGLEARVGELEATQFSTTTKLKGSTTFVLGAVTANSSREAAANSFNSNWGAATFNYDTRLSFDTSFTGKDLLRTRLRAGNFGNSVFGGGAAGNGMEVAFEEASGANSVGVDRVFYQFPIGGSFTATVGGRVRQDDMLAVWPSAYPADTVLDVFTYAGAPGAYSLTLGSGAGLSWSDNGFSVSANYVSTNGNSSNAGTGDTMRHCEAGSGGIATDCAGSNGTAQLAYTADQWGIAAAYTYSSRNGGGIYNGNGTPSAVAAYSAGNTNAWGLSAYWSPEESGWIPSISTGWGINKTKTDGVIDLTDHITSQSWYVGLQWSDVFLKGNSAGMAVGQSTFVTDVDWKSDVVDEEWVGDGQYAWEWWYKFQVTDNISVTPALFYLSAPRGQVFRTAGDRDATFNNFGGLIKTTFKF